MKIEGKVEFQAPREEVWDLFNDSSILAAATPGCERLEDRGGGVYEATLKLGIAAVRGTYQGTVTIRNQEPPRRYELAVEGSGGPGFVNTVGEMVFEEQDGSTVVNYSWDVKAGGAIAGVGQRVLGGVARWLIGDFFKAMQRELAARRS